MSDQVVNIMKKRFEEYAATLPTEHVQTEYNRKSFHYAWMIRQAQEYMEAELGPFATELKKRLSP